MLQVFALAVHQLPYSRHEWMMAINARFLSKLYMRTRKVDRFTLAQALNLAWRVGFYRRMRGIAAGNAKYGRLEADHVRGDGLRADARGERLLCRPDG